MSCPVCSVVKTLRSGKQNVGKLLLQEGHNFDRSRLQTSDYEGITIQTAAGYQYRSDALRDE